MWCVRTKEVIEYCGKKRRCVGLLNVSYIKFFYGELGVTRFLRLFIDDDVNLRSLLLVGV